MILGVLSDTHKDRMNALPHVITEFQKRGVQTIIHCGDILPHHLKPELFGNLPVVCALTDEQVREKHSVFTHPPAGWIFTRPNKRIVDLADVRVYVGHKRAFEFLYGSESKLFEMLNTISLDYDMVRFLFSGHTHHQIFMQGPLIDFINPGAIEDSMGALGGYAYAVIDTEKSRIIFARIPSTKMVKPPLTVGIVSDSKDISEIDVNLWQKLTEEFRRQQVTHIIHCGNIALSDIGRQEFDGFQVYYNLLPGQKDPEGPRNWHIISPKEPVVEIKGYHFYVQYNLGAILLDKSESDMYRLSLEVQAKYPLTNFLLFGFSHSGFYEEGQNMVLLNPGYIAHSRSFAVVALPQNEITFSRIPLEPLVLESIAA